MPVATTTPPAVSASSAAHDVCFLRHGGAIGARIAAQDWSATSLGPLAQWPATIKALLATWLDSPQAMFVAWGPDLRFFFNEAYLPFLGQRGVGAIGQPFPVVWPDVWEAVEPIVRQALAGRGERYESMPLRMERNGYPEQTWWTFTYMPVRDEHGDVIGMMCTTSDATASVLAARRAEQQRALQDSMLQQMPGFVGLVSGPAHVYDYVNDAFLALVGQRDILGRSVREVFPDLEGQGFFELMDQVFTTGTPFVAQALPARLAGDSQERYLDLLYYPVRDGEGAVSGIFVGGYDVTQRVRAEMDLRAFADTLEQRVQARSAELMNTQTALRHAQKMEAIGKLTGGVAHDFNNLLTVIGSSAELLRRPQVTEERRRKYVETIAETVRRAAALTSQLLAFARRQPLKPEVFDVCRQVDAISELVRPLTGPNITLRLPSCAEALYAECDVNQFETALVNLAANARDAMAVGGILSIDVGPVDAIPAWRGQAARPGAFIAVAVNDTGIGIADARLDTVFEPFYTTKDVGKGTGLGLSQVFGFCKQSGGDVRVHSVVGQGSTFTVYLPRAAGLPAAATSSAQAADPALEGAALTLLVVEDNTLVGRSSTDMLQDLGFTTEWATDAAQALALLAQSPGRFDLVFSDVVMPGMSGIELAQRIRSRYPGLPVLLASGYSDVIAEAGTQGFELIQKPYSVDTLVRVMRQAVAARHTGA